MLVDARNHFAQGGRPERQQRLVLLRGDTLLPATGKPAAAFAPQRAEQAPGELFVGQCRAVHGVTLAAAREASLENHGVVGLVHVDGDAALVAAAVALSNP